MLPAGTASSTGLGAIDTANANRDLGGFVTGVDAGLSGGWRAGLATGYLRTNLSTAGRSSAEVDSYVPGAYAGGAIGDGFAFRSGGTWIWNDIDTSHSVAFPGFLEQELGTELILRSSPSRLIRPTLQSLREATPRLKY